MLCVRHVGRFVIVWGGNIWASPSSLATSTNGLSWTPVGIGVFEGSCNVVGFDPSTPRIVAVGFSRNTIAWSNDGVNWNGLGTVLSLLKISRTPLPWEGRCAWRLHLKCRLAKNAYLNPFPSSAALKANMQAKNHLPDSESCSKTCHRAIWAFTMCATLKRTNDSRSSGRSM